MISDNNSENGYSLNILTTPNSLEKQNENIFKRALEYFSTKNPITNNNNLSKDDRNIQINISPKIYVNNNGQNNTSDDLATTLISMVKQELPRILKDIEYDKKRISFNN